MYIIYRTSVVNSVFFHKMGGQFLFLAASWAIAQGISADGTTGATQKNVEQPADSAAPAAVDLSLIHIFTVYSIF